MTLRRRRGTPSHESIVEITANNLSHALFGEPISYMNLGRYPGTDIPLRPIPADTLLTVVYWSGGGLVQDSDGGWIADRFGPGLGQRQVQRVLEGRKRS